MSDRISVIEGSDEEFEALLSSYKDKGGKMSLNIPFMRETMMLVLSSIDCAGCGKCCRRPTASNGGHTALWPEEVLALARLKGVTPENFRRNWLIPPYLSKDPWRRSGQARTLEMRCDPCPFYQPGTYNCRIHARCPMACRLYPIDVPAGDGSLSVQIECPEAFRIAREVFWAIRRHFQRYGVTTHSDEVKQAYLEAVVTAIQKARKGTGKR